MLQSLFFRRLHLLFVCATKVLHLPLGTYLWWSIDPRSLYVQCSISHRISPVPWHFDFGSGIFSLEWPSAPPGNLLGSQPFQHMTWIFIFRPLMLANKWSCISSSSQRWILSSHMLYSATDYNTWFTKGTWSDSKTAPTQFSKWLSSSWSCKLIHHVSLTQPWYKLSRN